MTLVSSAGSAGRPPFILGYALSNLTGVNESAADMGSELLTAQGMT
jgi:hypothetical protein